MNFKLLPNEEKPRERLIKYGKENISTEELIEIIIKSGTRKIGLREIAHNILSSVNNINEFKNMEIGRLINISGVSKIKAIELIAAIELGRRVYEDSGYDELVYLTNPTSIINYFHSIYKDEKQELFYVIYLDNQKKYIDKKLLFKGTVNFSLVHPREIFKNAYLLSSSYIVCIHNHPSGDASPSNNDIELTSKLKYIGDIHGIILLDHIIIGKNNYYSFFEDNNILKNGK
ncbi:MAG: DNA repair protein RadC [Bacilli bacterium]